MCRPFSHSALNKHRGSTTVCIRAFCHLPGELWPFLWLLCKSQEIRYSFRYLHPTNKSILSYSDTQCTFSNLLISISQFKWRKECLCSAYTFHYCRSSAWWFVRQTRGNQHCEPLVFRCRSTNWLSGLLCCWREELIPTQKAPTRANAQIHTACCDTDVASVTMLHRNRCWQMHALEGALLHYGPSWLFLQFYIV